MDSLAYSLGRWETRLRNRREMFRGSRRDLVFGGKVSSCLRCGMRHKPCLSNLSDESKALERSETCLSPPRRPRYILYTWKEPRNPDLPEGK